MKNHNTIKKEKALVKQLCICCEKNGKKTNKEHIFPKWLLKKTNTLKNTIKISGKWISGNSCVIPICEECNLEFGEKLEVPVSKIFKEIEVGNGFNDYDAELLARWMWKITGMFYWMEHAKTKYDYGFTTLKEKCLNDIEEPRERISIAISLIENEYSTKYADTAIGIDVIPVFSNVLSAGVFHKIAILVYYTKFSQLIPNSFTKYQLSRNSLIMNPNYKIKPITGFIDQEKAIYDVIQLSNNILLPLHEYYSIDITSEYEDTIPKNQKKIN